MMAEIAKLMARAAARASATSTRRPTTARSSVLMAGKSDPVITKKPEGAWTHAVWDKASGG